MADAEDLAHDTFIQAFRHSHQFRGHAKLSSWLYRIAMNLCLNWQKPFVCPYSSAIKVKPVEPGKRNGFSPFLKGLARGLPRLTLHDLGKAPKEFQITLHLNPTNLGAQQQLQVVQAQKTRSQ